MSEYIKNPHQDYQEVDTLRDGELCAVVTRRRQNGRLTYRILKEFTKGGKTRHTSYLSSRHLDSVQRLLVRIKQLERKERG